MKQMYRHKGLKTLTRLLSTGALGLALIASGCSSPPDRTRPTGRGPEQLVNQPGFVSIPVPPPAPAPRPVVRQPTAPAALTATITSLARNFDGIIGIGITSVDDGWSTEAGGLRRLPQQSVSKLWVSMTVLDLADHGRLTLNDPITLTQDDLTVFHQPVAALIGKDGYHTTIGELMRRAMTMSDNTCNDRLLRYVGGPEAVRAFIARSGLGDIRFGPGERLLQAGTAGLPWRPAYSTGNAFAQARATLPTATRLTAFNAYVANPPDGAAPAAIARALARLKRGELLRPNSTALLIGLMEESKTGKARLRGAVPPGWSFGHKTGTGQDFQGRTAGYNDVGILIAPDGKSYGLAVMIGDSPRTIPQKQAVMQAVVTAIVASHGI